MTPKLCKDCENFIKDGEKCGVSPKPINFVTGEPNGYFHAQTERETFNGCGPDAKFWTPKKIAA